MNATVKVHGLKGVGGADYENLELERLAQPPSDARQGRIWFDITSAGVAVAINEDGSPANIKQLAFLSDIPQAINGRDGSTTLLGNGVPLNTQGKDTDWYLDSDTGDFYNKSAGSWTVRLNLKGLNGSTVYNVGALPPNTFGNDKDWALNTNNGDLYYKQNGVWGLEYNLKGKDGQKGSSVLTGASDPLAALGVAGDSFINVISGDTFSKETGSWVKNGNIRGPAGADGASVLNGTSNPTPAEGKVRDTFINTTSWDVFSKASNGWANVGNIRGLAGSSVLSGSSDPAAGLGTDKDGYVNLVTGDTFSKATGNWVKSGNIKGKDATIGVNLQSYYGQVGTISGTTTIPSRDSAPLFSDGTEIWRFTITATEINTITTIEFNGVADASKRNCKVFFVLFRDGVVIDWTAVTSNSSSVGSPTPLYFRSIIRNSDVLPHTYVLRAGADSATTWFLGRGADKTMGNINESYFTYTETRTS